MSLGNIVIEIKEEEQLASLLKFSTDNNLKFEFNKSEDDFEEMIKELRNMFKPTKDIDEAFPLGDMQSGLLD